MAVRPYGRLAVWRYGRTAARQYGRTAVRPFGRAAVRPCGRAAPEALPCRRLAGNSFGGGFVFWRGIHRTFGENQVNQDKILQIEILQTFGGGSLTFGGAFKILAGDSNFTLKYAKLARILYTASCDWPRIPYDAQLFIITLSIKRLACPRTCFDQRRYVCRRRLFFPQR